MAFHPQYADSILAKDEAHDAVTPRTWNLDQALWLAGKKFSAPAELLDLVTSSIRYAYEEDPDLEDVERIGWDWLPDIGFGMIEHTTRHPGHSSQSMSDHVKPTESHNELAQLLIGSNHHGINLCGVSHLQDCFHHCRAGLDGVSHHRRQQVVLDMLFHQLKLYDADLATQQITRLKDLHVDYKLVQNAELINESVLDLQEQTGDPGDVDTMTSLRSAMDKTDHFVPMLKRHIHQLGLAHVVGPVHRTHEAASQHRAHPAQTATSAEMEYWKKVPRYIDAKGMLSYNSSSAWSSERIKALEDGLKHVCREPVQYSHLCHILAAKEHDVSAREVSRTIVDFVARKSVASASTALENIHEHGAQSRNPHQADLSLHCLEALQYAYEPPEGSRRCRDRLKHLKQRLDLHQPDTWQQWMKDGFELCKNQHVLMGKHMSTINHLTGMHDLAKSAEMFAAALKACEDHLKPSASLDAQHVHSAAEAVQTAIQRVVEYDQSLKAHIEKQPHAQAKHVASYEKHGGAAMEHIARTIGGEQHERWKKAAGGQNARNAARLGARVASGFVTDGTVDRERDDQNHAKANSKQKREPLSKSGELSWMSGTQKSFPVPPTESSMEYGYYG